MTIKSGQRIEWQGKSWLVKADCEVAPAPAPTQSADGWQRLDMANPEVPGGVILEFQHFSGATVAGRYEPMLRRFVLEKGNVSIGFIPQFWRYPVRAPKRKKAVA